MNKTFCSFIVMTAVMAMSVSCSKQVATGVNVPDSLRVVQDSVRIIIDGELADYYDVPMKSYHVSMTDTTASCNVTLNRIKQYVKNDVVEAYLSNGDSCYAAEPYIVLLDSLGHPIANSEMVLGKQDADNLMNMMTADSDAQMEMTFVGKKKLTDEDKNKIAGLARNFKIIARFSYNVDNERLDKLISQYAASVNEAKIQYNEFRDCFGGSIRPMIHACWKEAADAAFGQEKILKGVVNNMSASQKEKFQKAYDTFQRCNDL